MDDSTVFKRRSSLLSNSSSRRSHTPQARPTYLSSSASSNRRSAFSRSTSRREEGSSHGVVGRSHGLKSRPVSNNASPKTSPFTSPREKDQTLSDLFGPVHNLSSPPSSSPINGVKSSPTSSSISKSVSKRDKDDRGSATSTSVPFSKSTSTRQSDKDTVGSMGKSISRRSTTPIVFSQSTPPKKPMAIEKKLECTLEELCHGGVKNIKITRDIITDEGFVSLLLFSFFLGGSLHSGYGFGFRFSLV